MQISPKKCLLTFRMCIVLMHAVVCQSTRNSFEPRLAEPTILHWTFGILARHFTVQCLVNIKFFAGHLQTCPASPANFAYSDCLQIGIPAPKKVSRFHWAVWQTAFQKPSRSFFLIRNAHVLLGLETCRQPGGKVRK